MRAHLLRPTRLPASTTLFCLIALSAMIFAAAVPVQAQDAQTAQQTAQDAGQQDAPFPKYAEFAKSWQDDQWIPREGRRFPQHIRDLADTGWQLRMLALHEVVAAGEKAVPFLVERLKSGEPHERIFAAQALGLLGKHAPLEPLLDALEHDADPAVQLYAADALGMRGDADLAGRFEKIIAGIRNRDVQKHMKYAEERAGAAIDDAIVQKLANWKPEQLNTAELNKPAPDFELATVGGEQTIKLSDYLGKKNVVLVFIYGDT